MNAPWLNVTLPVLDEERLLERSVERVLRFLEEQQIGPHEVVIADNGSTDGTAGVAEALAAKHPSVRAVHLSEAGRGRALRQVWGESRAEILSYMDIDLSTDLAAFPRLLDCLTTGGFDLAVGSRRLPGARVERSWRRELPSLVYHALLRRLFRVRFTDVQCGFKAIRREAADRLLGETSDAGWFMDAELMILAERIGYRVAEVPVCWRESDDSRVRMGRDAWATLRAVLKLRRRLRGERVAGNGSRQKSDRSQEIN